MGVGIRHFIIKRGSSQLVNVLRVCDLKVQVFRRSRRAGEGYTFLHFPRKLTMPPVYAASAAFFQPFDYGQPCTLRIGRLSPDCFRYSG